MKNPQTLIIRTKLCYYAVLKIYDSGSAIWEPLFESNEAIRCEYISVILHACINIVRELTGKKISLNPQIVVVGEENTGRVDYAIKALEELICITEGKQY